MRALTAAALLAAPALATAQNAPAERAISQLAAQRSRLGLSEADLRDPAITSQYTDAHNGLTHTYLRQRYQGVEVYGAVADVHLDRAGKVASLNSSFLPNVTQLARPATPALSAEQAVAAAAKALNMPAPGSLQTLKAGTAAAGMEFSDAGISLEKISVKLMYLPLADGSLRLVWDVTLAPLSADHYWSARVDASTGVLLDKNDLTISESFSVSTLTRPVAQMAAAAASPQPAVTPVVGRRPNVANSYNVWPLTVESPTHGARQLMTNPADVLASPFGWHDTDGVAGAEYTITRGNNVHAYDDRNNRNVYSAATSVSPDGGANLEFDFPFNSLKETAAATNLNAAVVNLFYWNNLVHDIMFRKGFNEVSGNFQAKNYGATGLGNDAVRAEAQDGATLALPNLNNANFSAPADGSPPRMQMYLWDRSELAINITAPAALAGSLNALEGSLGRKLSNVGPITANLVVVNDGSAKPERGCNEPLVNAAAVNGSIALIERGKCGFANKIKNAQNAGARMVIMMDSVPNSTTLTRMGGSAPDTIGLRIPSVFITKADGERLKTAARSGQIISISASGALYYRDGDFDNGIIAHEYGHGISNRLTGGPATTSCLNNAEQMGEGWSDFFGLWMTTKPGDVGTAGRGIGTYASFEPTTGPGIRPTRYSTDMSINPSTYALIGTTGYTAVHSIGYVWASVLWDLNWALINRYGYNADLTGTTGGNNIALQLVIDGLKLQKCSPGFLDGRDAILKADAANNGGANADLIWKVFARRGMGANAVQGSSNSLTDNTAGYELPAVLSTQKALNESLVEVYPNPAHDQLTVRTQVSSATPVMVEVLTMLGRKVMSSSAAPARIQSEGLRLNTSELANGLYVVRLTTSEGTMTKKVVVQH
ncbi:T9SS-dependent M36 family metallopeptidase [Hymenobacter chitinivorans]|uniref:Putative secreted protein (Por secretion system target) n=1 Tax=Hymenobacter chitinivorans DSM 11115 TaxID=1121954 RepID=A0A2M9B991_9BACT|nr:T9SS-dependent M36 family metallopeptidase [Hymenobacter chitinivorans]PJJ54487.1 putative secreted protein (Por secretion system target) [Hymenobacter chitinivorans DSM 11115]